MCVTKITFAPLASAGYTTCMGTQNASVSNFPRAITSLPDGSVVVVGTTDDPTFPTTADAYDRTCSCDGTYGDYADGFVTRLDPSGALVVSTFLGTEDENEQLRAVATDPVTGEVVVAGWTHGATLPIVGGPATARINTLGRSSDGLATWSPRGFRREFRVFAVSPANPDILLGANELELLQSSDGGITWTLRHRLRYEQGRFPFFHGIAISPDGATAYAATQAAVGLLRSTDGGVTWSSGTLPTGPQGSIYQIGTSPANAALVLVCDENGLQRSLDRAASFTKVRNGCGPFTSTPGGVLFTGGGAPARSVDGGATWTSITAPEGRPVEALAVNPVNPDELLASFDVPGTGTTGTLVHARSVDGGQTWTRLATLTRVNGFRELDVAFDPSTPGRAYASTTVSPPGAATLLTDLTTTWRIDAGVVTTHPEALRRLTFAPGTPAIAYRAPRQYGDDVYVARFTPDLKAITYSGLLSSSDLDQPSWLGVGRDGQILVGGVLAQIDGPATHSLGTATRFRGTAFVARLDPRLAGDHSIVDVALLPSLVARRHARRGGRRGRRVRLDAPWDAGLPRRLDGERRPEDTGGRHRRRDAETHREPPAGDRRHLPRRARRRLRRTGPSRCAGLALHEGPRAERPGAERAARHARVHDWHGRHARRHASDSGLCPAAPDVRRGRGRGVLRRLRRPRTPRRTDRGAVPRRRPRTAAPGREHRPPARHDPGDARRRQRRLHHAHRLRPPRPAPHDARAGRRQRQRRHGVACAPRRRVRHAHGHRRRRGRHRHARRHPVPHHDAGIAGWHACRCGGDRGRPDADAAGAFLPLADAALAGDADGDGLADAWEARYSLDPTRNDAQEDADGDGVTNADELAAGTHPTATFARYLAEGAQSTFFSHRLALLNPGEAPVTAVVRSFTGTGDIVTKEVLVEGRRRLTVEAAAQPELVGQEFSSEIEAAIPLVVERTMTWNATRYGSHSETATIMPATQWYFAEGATLGPFDLFYLLQNPGTTHATVQGTYLLGDGTVLEKTYTVPARSRFNIWADVEQFDNGGTPAPLLAAAEFSAIFEVTAGPKIIAERAMYLSNAAQFAAGHQTAGNTAPATRWFLAEGATGNFFDLFVLVGNPGTTAAELTVTYLLPNGTSKVKTYTVGPRSRFNIWVDEEQFPEGSGDKALADTAVSVVVESANGVPVIVERAMWWPGPTSATWAEAHNSVANRAPAARWGVADAEVGAGWAQGDCGTADDCDETYVLIANTGAVAGTVRATVLFEDAPPESRDFAVAANSRLNISVRDEFPATIGKRVGLLVESVGVALPLVVERATYGNAAGVKWAAGANAPGTPLP